jgi:hypothetical protein
MRFSKDKTLIQAHKLRWCMEDEIEGENDFTLSEKKILRLL